MQFYSFTVGHPLVHALDNKQINLTILTSNIINAKV